MEQEESRELRRQKKLKKLRKENDQKLVRDSAYVSIEEPKAAVQNSESCQY